MSPTNIQTTSNNDFLTNFSTFKKKNARTYVFLLLLLILLSILAAITLSPHLLTLFIKDAQTPISLLQGYHKWYIVILLDFSLNFLVCVIVFIHQVLIFIRYKAFYVNILRRILLTLLSALIFSIYMLIEFYKVENPYALIKASQEDIQQIENRQLEQGIISFNSNYEPDGLPGPYTEGLPKPCIRYSAIGKDTKNKWIPFYIPTYLGFEVDDKKLFNENASISWNEENAQHYIITYTTNFHLVVEIAPVS